jgi:hypothetical protein
MTRPPCIGVPYVFADCSPVDGTSPSTSPALSLHHSHPKTLNFGGAFSPYILQHSQDLDQDTCVHCNDSQLLASDTDASHAYQGKPRSSASTGNASESPMACKHCTDGHTCPAPHCPRMDANVHTLWPMPYPRVRPVSSDSASADHQSHETAAINAPSFGADTTEAGPQQVGTTHVL